MGANETGARADIVLLADMTCAAAVGCTAGCCEATSTTVQEGGFGASRGALQAAVGCTAGCSGAIFTALQAGETCASCGDGAGRCGGVRERSFLLRCSTSGCTWCGSTSLNTRA